MRIIDADALKFGLEKVTLYVQGLRFGKTVLGKILEAYRRAVYEEIEAAPTIDPEELRPKGEWEVANDGTHFCSRCGYDAPFTWDDIDRHFINSADDVPDRPTNYCPNCGADMRGA